MNVIDRCCGPGSCSEYSEESGSCGSTDSCCHQCGCTGYGGNYSQRPHHLLKDPFFACIVLNVSSGEIRIILFDSALREPDSYDTFSICSVISKITKGVVDSFFMPLGTLSEAGLCI